jgi:hypothetical protein
MMARSASIQKVSIKHEAIMDFLILNPTMKMAEVAAHFGVTFPWLSTIVHSHAFQDLLRKKQDELFDCAVVQEVGGKLEAAAQVTLDAYLEKVPTLTADQLISSSDKLLGRLGYGTRNGSVNVNVGEGANLQINQVNGEVLAKARDKIGINKVGSADSLPALQDKSTETGTQIEGSLVREEGEPSVNGKVRDHELHSEPVVQVPEVRREDKVLPDGRATISTEAVQASNSRD